MSIPSADPDKLRYTWTCQGWQRSGNLARDRPILSKIWAGTSPAEPEFFCVVIQTTFRELCNGRFSLNLVMKRTSVYRRWIRKDIFENFYFRGLAPKIWNRQSVKQAPHSEQATGQGMHRREIMFTPRCSPRATEFLRSVNFSVRRTIAELRGVKFVQFSDFGLSFLFKILKTYATVRWPAYSPWVTSQTCYDFDQRCLKTRNSEHGCTFPQNILARLPLPPKLPKTPFWGTFQYKTYYTEKSPWVTR